MTNLAIDDLVSAFCGDHGLRLVYASTTAIYGHRRDEQAIDEATPPSPAGPYAEAKLASERLISERCAGATSLRLSSPYGRGMTRGVVRTFVDRARAGEDLILWGSGRREQDFIHCDDVARSFVAALDSPAHVGVVNICSGEGVPMARLADAVITASHSTCTVRFAGVDPLDAQRVRLSNGLARSALGWEPHIGLGSGIADLMARKA